MKKSDAPIIVEEHFPVSVEDVWNAITQLDQMKQWFFENIPAFEAKVGFETEFVVQVEDRVFPHLWKITEVIYQKKITYNWKYRGYEGDSLVHFELLESESGTLLRLTTEILEDFQSEVPEFSKENCYNGWNFFIRQNLKQYLEST